MSTPPTVAIRAAGLLFDMDGTLVDSHASIVDTWTAYAHSRALEVHTVLDLLPGRTAVDIITALRPYLGPYRLADDIDWIRNRERTCTVPVRAMPGAVDLLSRLDPTGWTVVTAASRTMMTRRLISAGLPLPAISICADDVAAGKPSPEGYLVAAQRLGVRPSDCVVFEDATSGLLAAHAAGAVCIALGSAEGPADHRIRDLTHVSAHPTTSGHGLEIRP